MPTITPVTGESLIRPDDLFKFYSDEYWGRAKFACPGWIGKSVRSFAEFGNNAHMVNDFAVIRTTASDKALRSIGIIVTIPNATMRHFWQTSMGKLGRKSDYPKDFKLNFGKYKDQPISKLIYENKRYLEWIYDEDIKCMPEAHRKILGEWLNKT